jgi:molybdopterin-guanine dinucleotide biosynthesis protein A
VLFAVHLADNPLLGTINKTGLKRNPSPGFKDSRLQRFNVRSAEICILAGGLSRRMGRDKSLLRLGSTTMLGHIRNNARATGLPVRVIRRDCVTKCGPLGGIYTALKGTRADAVLFLACDMPLVTKEVIEFVLGHFGDNSGNVKVPIGALFVRTRGRPGFPFILQRENVVTVHHQIEKGELSLQSLAKTLKATILPLERPWSRLLYNINTPREWAIIRHRQPW